MALRDNLRLITDNDVAGTLSRYATGEYQPTPLTAAAAQVNGNEGAGVAHGPVRHAQARAYDAIRPITASAQKINLKNADDILGLRNRVYCLANSAQILTREGWKTHDTLQVGEDIWTINPKTCLGEWQPVKSVNVFDVVDEPMYRFHSQSHNSLSTANHRWFGHRPGSARNEFVTSEEIGDTPFEIPICAKAAQLPTEAVYTDEYVELVAWLMNEGHIPPPAVNKRALWRFKSPEHKKAWREFYDAEFERSKTRPPRFNGLRYGIINYKEDIANNGLPTLTLQRDMAKKTEKTLEEIQEFFELTPTIQRRAGEISQYKSVNPDNWKRIHTLLQHMFGAECTPFAGGELGRRDHIIDGVSEPRWYSGPKRFRLNEEIIQHFSSTIQDSHNCPRKSFIYELTENQLYLFIETSLRGDGCVSGEYNTKYFAQNREDRTEIFELACHLTGQGLTRTVRQEESGTMYVSYLRKRKSETLRPSDRTMESYTGIVWCPGVENSTWFVRDHGQMYWSGNTEWQNDSWSYTDAIGEISYGFGLIGACMSRIKLYPAINFAEETVPLSISEYRTRLQKIQIEGEPAGTLPTQTLDPNSQITPEVLAYAERLMRDLRSGSGGSSGMMRAFALNMCVAGECYLVYIKRRWYIKSTSELIVSQGGDIILRTQRAGSSTTTAGTVYGDVILPRNTPIYRIWREHPRYSHEPVSSMLALREVCDELITLQRMIRSVARSHMNAGMLFFPDGITAAGNSVTADTAQAEEEGDAFAAAVYDSITAPIIDEASASSVVPTILTGPGEQGANIRYIQVNRVIDQFLVERCDRALIRILQGLDMPRDIITGNQGIKYCMPGHTHRALSKSGWKTWDELELEEEIWTINPDTKLGEWQPILAINTFDVVNEEMIQFEQNGHRSVSTADHRWFGRAPSTKFGGKMVPNFEYEFRTSDTINNRRFNIPLAAKGAHLPTVARYSDEFVELVAWLSTEQKVPKKRTESTDSPPCRRWGYIAQTMTANPGYRMRITTLPTRIFGTSVPTVDSYKVNGEILQTLDEVTQEHIRCPTKSFILDLTYTQLQLFVDVSIMAHGCTSGGATVFDRNRLDRQEAFELACHLLGQPINRRSNGQDPQVPERTWGGVSLKKRAEAGLMQSRSRKVSYTGKVWCPTTANGTWFCQNDGTFFFTGNSNAVIANDSLVVGHIEPLALMLCDALSSCYLRPKLKQAFPTLKDDDLDRLTIWYDPTELTLPPDSSASADTGLINNVLSADAWRQAHGFSAADAPGEQELIRNLLFKLAVLQPDQMEVLVQQAFPNVINNARAANIANSGTPMPESAQELLYPNTGQDGNNRDGSVPDEEPGAPDGKKRGANGEAPGGATTYTNQNNQENRSTQVRDQSLDGGNAYTRGLGANSGGYGKY